MIRKPRKCAVCRERSVVPATLPEYAEDMSHDGRTYHVVVHDLDVLKCENCGAMVFDDAANDRLSDALRTAADVYSPEEIRSKREALGLSQKQLSDLSAIAVATISRWENGGQIQQRCMNQFLRVLFEVPEARSFLVLQPQKESIHHGIMGR